MSTPGMGVWKAMLNVIRIAQNNDMRTTADFQRFFKSGATQLETEASCQYSDAEGFTIAKLVSSQSYSPSVRAKPAVGEGPTHVNVGVSTIAVEAIDTAGGSFSATLWVFAGVARRAALVLTFFQSSAARDAPLS